MLSVKKNETEIRIEETTLNVTLLRGEACWKWDQGYVPRMESEENTWKFTDATTIRHEIVENGVGAGIRSHFGGFESDGKSCSYEFETLVWIEACTGDVFFEWIPLCEEGMQIRRVYWPGHMAFEKASPDWYTVLNMQQGVLIPNTWETKLDEIPFEGRFGTAGGYMPWFAQFRGEEGYVAICTTPWNAGYGVKHPEQGPYTQVGIWFEPSLGKMEYRRITRYTLIEEGDYNTACKIYRRYVKEDGRLCTLAEKAARVQRVDELIGCSFLHKGIKTYVQPQSDFYDAKHPDKNNRLTGFATRAKEIADLHQKGAGKLYLHLDGWAEPGYDNNHPDYMPPCKEAGGREGMKELADTMHRCGDLFGIHDQYRDYYRSAASFEEEYACRLVDGSIPTHQRWAGGPQSYLCGTQAPYYVRRNFTALEEQGIQLDCAYLDVFTCNEGDECNNPRHRMTRKDCQEERNRCFDYLMSKGILPSSEEVSDWCVPSMVFSHYAPYDFMLRQPGSPRYGIPVPLFSLVYHDCLIVPWMMEKVSETEDYMLYALLNGGAPYLCRDGAYPNVDGAFDEGIRLGLEEKIERCKAVSRLHQKIAKCEMVRHTMVNKDPGIQKTEFADGTEVTVDFYQQIYRIGTKTEVGEWKKV